MHNYDGRAFSPLLLVRKDFRRRYNRRRIPGTARTIVGIPTGSRYGPMVSRRRSGNNVTTEQINIRVHGKNNVIVIRRRGKRYDYL